VHFLPQGPSLTAPGLTDESADSLLSAGHFAADSAGQLDLLSFALAADGHVADEHEPLAGQVWADFDPSTAPGLTPVLS
jgi:hypothetical protein